MNLRHVEKFCWKSQKAQKLCKNREFHYFKFYNLLHSKKKYRLYVNISSKWDKRTLIATINAYNNVGGNLEILFSVMSLFAWKMGYNSITSFAHEKWGTILFKMKCLNHQYKKASYDFFLDLWFLNDSKKF